VPFWSGETLRSRLTELIDPPNPTQIDCAAYTLKVGGEYYVTPNDTATNPGSITLALLDQGESFAVPAGQFAYVLTEEQVSVPTSAIAFISIRARIKFRGLVNVSGFHVDPGFSGRLLFAVYNAGPVSIHLRRGDPTFLIWFADLDQDVPADSKRGMAPITNIATEIITPVSGVIYSIQGLADKLRTVEKELARRVTALERENGIIKVLAGALLALLVALAVQWIARQFPAQAKSTEISAPAGPFAPSTVSPPANLPAPSQPRH
jgi:dCTP deaminase